MALLWRGHLHCDHRPPEISHSDQEAGRCQETTDFQVSRPVETGLNTKSWKRQMLRSELAVSQGEDKRDWSSEQHKVRGMVDGTCLSADSLLSITLLISPHGEW